MTLKKDDGFIGKGTPYFHAADGTIFDMGNCTKIAVTANSNTIERKSKQRESYGSALDSVTMPEPSGVSIEYDTFTPRTWAMALMGTATKASVTAKTVTDEAITAKLGSYFALANKQIDLATVAVKNGATVIDAAEYEIVTAMGYIKFNAGGTVAEGDALTINYTTLPVEKWVIDGAKVTTFRGKLVVDGENLVDGKSATLTIPNLSLAVNGELDWYSDEFNTVTMEGTAALPDGGGAPYVVELHE